MYSLRIVEQIRESENDKFERVVDSSVKIKQNYTKIKKYIQRTNFSKKNKLFIYEE